MNIRKGDQVKILSGKDRGKQGNVLKCKSEKNQLTVEGINIVKRHKKAKRRGQKGERLSLPSAINISNVQLICPSCGKATRIAMKISGDAKARICKKCGKEI